MATKVERKSRPARGGAPKKAAEASVGAAIPRLQIEYVDICDIKNYEYNPRDNSKAIEAVANSIKAFGFLIPCVIDDNNVLGAGHTRVAAATQLQMTAVPCIRASYLTPEQMNAFRLIDNKVAEQASWDYDMLAGEIAKLEQLDLDFTNFGWTQDEIDCMGQLVAADCLNTDNLVSETTEREVRTAERRAPLQARIVVGEFVFFVPATAYRNWADGIRRLHDFSDDAIVEDLKTRLGILE